MPVLVFLAVATIFGCLLEALVRLRLRFATLRGDAADAELCELRHARRITSAMVVASLVSLAAVGVLYLVLSV